MSDQLTPFVEGLEGTRLKAYRCPAGVWTVGTGHTSAAGAPVVTPNLVITQAQACEILARDLARVRAKVLALCAKVLGGLTEIQADALTSFVFNIGEGAFAGSTVLRKLKRGDFRGAADAMLAWTKAHVDGQVVTVAGLVKRRKAERALFLNGYEAAAAHASGDLGAMPQAVAKPKLRKPLIRSVTANAGAGVGAGGALFAWEGGKQAVAFMSDAKEQASAAATLFGIPEGSAVLLGGGIVIVTGAAVVLWRRYRRSIEDVVVEFTDGIHLPIVGDLLGREEDEVSVEATHVEASVETDEGIVHAEATHVEATVTAAADEAGRGSNPTLIRPHEMILKSGSLPWLTLTP